MSLLVHLPLLGNLDNYGLSEVALTNTSATVNPSGKIGQCYYFSAARIVGTMDFSSLEDHFSCSLWFKMGSLKSNTQLFNIGTASGWNNIRYGAVCNASGTITTSVSNGSSYVGWNFPIGTAVAIDQWYHYASTYDCGIMKVYLNGELKNTYSTTIVPKFSDIPSFGISAAPNGNEASTAWMNDFRLYDHVLSDKEVKDISKALVLHYPLNDPYIGNLVSNGYAREGITGWSVAPETSDLPSVTGCAGSYNGATNTNLIPIDSDHAYTYSEYIKTAGATSGSNYPSLLPYDYDKKFIANNNSAVGFSSATKTTLSKALNPGDTVVYATDLSKWTNATTNHYYYVAVFGYEDSSGYVYPDLTYTADSLLFGSMTDKSNLDIANNKITLKSAYTGKARPAGTTICQATAGSTYWYPFGGIAYANIADWTFKTKTFVPGDDSRLLAAAYVQCYTYPGAKHAAIKLTDDTVGTGVVTDCSGYHRDGTLYKEATMSPTTPRYDVSTHLIDMTSTTNTDSGAYISGPIPLTDCSAITFSFWGNLSKGYGGNWQGVMATSANASAPVDYTATAVNQYDSNFRFNNASGTAGNISANTLLVAGEWHHYALTYNGSTLIGYRDGAQVATASLTGALYAFNYIYLSYSKAGGVFRQIDGNWSDFRIYATALSASDIKELYQAGASIDNKQNLHAYWLNEEIPSENLLGSITAKSGNGTIVTINNSEGIQWNFSNSVDTYVFFKLNKALVATKTYWFSFDCEGLADSDNVLFGIPQSKAYADFKLHNGHNVVKVTGAAYSAGANFGPDDYTRTSSSVVTCSNFCLSEDKPTPSINKTGIVDSKEFSDGSTHAASIFIDGSISGKELIEI